MSDSVYNAIYNQVLDLHEHYNDLARLQQAIPSTRPRHSNYTNQEQAVRDKASEILRFARGIPSAGTDLHVEVDSIMEGCRQTMDNPYKKLAHVVKIPPRRS
ncbi:hypothetical protein GCM10028824_42780 [Hymenobacter segetis]|uniref:Uncharacterized protein n=1 Tax=Hymenobacter segetis TaxID=2025509 RepID=A0ABU9M0I8_9BACT